MKNTGECFCGDVRYEYEGELLDARSCHCSRCRKVFGAQASAFICGVISSWSGQRSISRPFIQVYSATLVDTFLDLLAGIAIIAMVFH